MKYPKQTESQKIKNSFKRSKFTGQSSTYRNENTTTGNRKNFSETCKLQNRIKGSDVFHIKRLLHESTRVRSMLWANFLLAEKLEFDLIFWFCYRCTLHRKAELLILKFMKENGSILSIFGHKSKLWQKHPDRTKHLQVIQWGRGASCNETYFQFQFKTYRKFQVTPHQSCKQTLYST